MSVVAVDGSWRASAVDVAGTMRARRLGVKAGCERLLLRANAVHTWGLAHGLRLVAIDDSGTVVAVRALAPGRFARLRSAKWVLEQPLAAPQPPVGVRLALYAQPGDWETRALRNPNREPQ